MLRTIHRDKNWYVLVYGVYSNKKQANVVLNKLPLALRQHTQPWIRTIASLQKRVK